MQQGYILVIKNERYKRVNILQHAFLALMALSFITASYLEDNIIGFIWPALLCMSIFISVNRADFMHFKFFRITNFKESGFLWAIAGTLLLLPWWIALLVIAVAIMQVLVKEQYQLLIKPELLEMNIYPKKTIEWNALQNLVVKDGMLTIDYKSDKILQAEIIPEQSSIVDEKEFNDFCRSQLAAHN